MNENFRFLSDPTRKTVEVEITDVHLHHGGYIVSGDTSIIDRVYGGVVLRVQG